MTQPADLVAWTRMRWTLDVNVIDHPDADDLKRLHRLGWVRLAINGTSYTEIDGAREKDPEKYARLVEQTVRVPGGTSTVDVRSLVLRPHGPRRRA